MTYLEETGYAHEETYKELLRDILSRGVRKPNRTGIDTIGVFGQFARYDISKYFPAVTAKKLAFKNVIAELVWFLSGSRDINDLHGIYPKCKIWDANYDDYVKRNGYPDLGDCGAVYGHMWRSFPDGTVYGIDQIEQSINTIRNDPQSRRNIVTAWHPAYISSSTVALPPCHVFFQFDASIPGELSVSMLQRSADMFLGVPFNIASYSALLHVMAILTDRKPKYFIHQINDAHIYVNHLDAVREYLGRSIYQAPALNVERCGQTRVEDFKMSDFSLIGYQSHESIKAEMAV